MDIRKFLTLVTQPNKVSSEEEKDLRDLVIKYPYFQAARILLAKATGASSEEVKTAAAYTQNRTVLKRVMDSEFNANINLPNTQNLDIHPQDLNAFDKLSGEYKEENIEEAEENHISQDLEQEEVNETFDLKTEQEEKDKTSLSIIEITESQADFKEKEEDNNDSIPSELEMLERFQGFLKNKETFHQDETEEGWNEEDDTDVEILLLNKRNKEVIDNEEEVTPPIFNEQLVQDKKLAETSNLPVQLSIETVAPATSFSLLNETSSKTEKEYQADIIDNFIVNNPVISVDKDKENKPQKDLSAQYACELKGPLAEHYAHFLEKEGKSKAAIKIYQALILKNPKKKSYFANRIENLNNNI